LTRSLRGRAAPPNRGAARRGSERGGSEGREVESTRPGRRIQCAGSTSPPMPRIRGQAAGPPGRAPGWGGVESSMRASARSASPRSSEAPQGVFTARSLVAQRLGRRRDPVGDRSRSRGARGAGRRTVVGGRCRKGGERTRSLPGKADRPSEEVSEGRVRVGGDGDARRKPSTGHRHRERRIAPKVAPRIRGSVAPRVRAAEVLGQGNGASGLVSVRGSNTRRGAARHVGNWPPNTLGKGDVARRRKVEAADGVTRDECGSKVRFRVRGLKGDL
jgi:hypothetical protein